MQTGDAREAVGEMLRAARLRAGYTLEDTAVLAGISAGHLAAVERGAYVPAERTARLLTAGLCLDEQERALLAGVIEVQRASHPWRRPYKSHRLRRTA